MAKLRTLVVWSIGGLAAILLALTFTGAIGPTYRWMVRYFAPEVWSAIGTWATALIALITVLVAGRYAKQQVDEARRTREEQAQPNVVLYSEPNPDAPQIHELVVRNFGTTPAYDVAIEVDPPIKTVIGPNHDGPSKISIPSFPILAPNQEWRTIWDSAVQRKNYRRSLERKLKNEEISQSEFDHQDVKPRHKAVVKYSDSRENNYETPSALDFDARIGTTWVDINTLHDLTEMLEKKFDAQNKYLDAIHDRLAEFGTEHEGVWIYNSSDDEERQYRRFIAAAQRREARESNDHFNWQLSGRNGEDPQTRANLDDAFQVPIENAKIGDWYVPQTDAPVEAWQAWRIAFVKRHVSDDFGTVYELFRSDGESVRERKGTQIQIVRADPS